MTETNARAVYAAHGAEPANELTVEDLNQGFDYWLSRPFVDATLRTDLKDANLLLVPQEGFRNHDGPLFPVRTEELFGFLRDRAPDTLKVDICVRDEDYKELALHADWLIISGAVVTLLMAPLAVNLITEYVKNRLWPGEDKRGIKFRLTIQNGQGASARAVTLSVESPADMFVDTLKAAVDVARQQLGSECLSMPDPPKRLVPSSDAVAPEDANGKRSP